MQVGFETRAAALIASVIGRVDTATAPAFEQALNEALGREETCWVMDLAGLAYISSAGLRVFLSTAKTLKARGGELRLAAAQGSVKKVLQVSGLFTLFKYFDTRDAALEDLQAV